MNLKTAPYSSILKFLGGLAVIALVAFAFFYPDASTGAQLQQHDMQQGIAIGQEAKAFHEATGQTTRWTNALFGGMPTFQISPSYPSSALFGWVNTVMGLGLPSPSNLLAMMMIGFFILLTVMGMRWYVALLGAIAYGLSSYFVIIIGAGHIWKFVTLAYIPPTIAGIILCYRRRYLPGGAMAAFFAMMQIASNHVQMTYYFLFVIIGIVIATLIQAIRTKALRQWTISTAVLAAAATLAVTANIPSLYYTYEYSKESMRGRHTELTPTQTADSQQAPQGNGLDKNYITQYSYQPTETFSLLIPNIKGGASARPTHGQMAPMSLTDLPEAQKMIASGQVDQMQQQYLSYMSQYFGDPEGTNGPVYVGALIIALFIAGLLIVRGPMKWALAILTLFSILMAWGRHAMLFTDLSLTLLPMYGKFRTVESILVIAEFTIPLLAAMALQTLLTTPDAWTKYRRPLLWSFGITLGLCLIGIFLPGLFGDVISDNDRTIDQYITSSLLQQGYDPSTASQFSLQNPAIYNAVHTLRTGLISSDALRSFLICAIGAAILYLAIRRKLPTLISGIALTALVLTDLYIVDKRYISHDSFIPAHEIPAAKIAKIPADDQILQDTAINYRVMDIPRFYSADPSYYHKTIGGYHAAKLTRYQDMIDRHLAAFTRNEQTDADWNILNMLNARYIISADGQAIRNPEAYGNAWFIDKIDYLPTPDAEMQALSTIAPDTTAVADIKFKPILGQATPLTPGDTIYQTTYAPNRLTYHARSAKGGIAVFSEIYFPWGWTATIDGQPASIGRVDYLLRAIRIPAGTHTIEMAFEPASLRTTDTAATAAILLIYIAVLAAIALSIRQLGKTLNTPTPKE